ncbi:MAG: co-chaperone GroES [Deltaproteobacteria bacterium]|nr:co-chaperone GroES [Deltaproteobacteria bacterium]MBW2031971.1 co-chaperone GroES [Deltaproteobacteria bacterium]
MDCPIDPEGTKVVIVPDKVGEKTAGGLIIVPSGTRQQEQNAVTQGTLVAIGPRAEICWNNGDGKEIAAKIGDRVIYARYGGTQFNWGKKTFQLLQDQDVVGKMLEEPPAVDLVLKQ